MEKNVNLEEIFGSNNEYISGPNEEVVSIETITPEMARELLKTNTNNRRVKEVTLDRYARDMENGRWTFTGEPISITEDGVLGNGQTRLMACIKADKPFTTIVVRKLKSKAVRNTDVGAQRNVADALRIDGVQDSNILSSAARKMLVLESGKNETRIAYSFDEILEEITKSDREDYYKKVSKFAKEIYKEYKIIPISCISAAYVKLRLLGHSEEIIQDFFDQLSDRKEACGVIRSLRKRVSKVDGRSINAREKFQLLIRTWNEFAKGNYDAVILRNTSKIHDFI